MNYEQKYNEALDAARHIYEDMKSGGNFGGMEDLEVIFPELRESEDERIREELVYFIQKEKEYMESQVKPENSPRLRFFIDALAWIEKQKEQKPLTVEDVVEQSKRFGREVEVLHKDEQKLQDQCVDVIKMSALLAADRLASAEMTGRLKERKEILENPEKYGLCKPAEQISNIIAKAFENSKTDYSLEEREKASDYSERVLPTSITYGEDEDEYRLHKVIEAAYIAGQKEQKPAEWSEEDKKMRQDLIAYFVGEDVIHNPGLKFYEAAEWLKSLRPQPHWKPSEEQMKALIDCVIGNEYDVHALVRLWAELKKL